uniref:Activin_recp domain-containing protein n=1 Tax=Strongyloides papillosus TaxID=174720 RepID=A0A0N5CAG2_STREA
MQCPCIIIFIINFFITLTFSIECYFGRGTISQIPTENQICDTAGVGISYCMKMVTGNDFIRGCDTQNLCKNIGPGCKQNQIYSYYTGELCCCNTNKCNSSSNIFQIKSRYMIILLFMILIGLFSRYL